MIYLGYNSLNLLNNLALVRVFDVYDACFDVYRERTVFQSILLVKF